MTHSHTILIESKDVFSGKQKLLCYFTWQEGDGIQTFYWIIQPFRQTINLKIICQYVLHKVKLCVMLTILGILSRLIVFFCSQRLLNYLAFQSDDI